MIFRLSLDFAITMLALDSVLSRTGGRRMLYDNRLTTQQTLEIFEEEMAAAGGTVHDEFHDGTRLFARSTLPAPIELAPGDRVQGGVAIRASEGEIAVHPYTFRQVCSNGAIHAHAVQTRRVITSQFFDPDEAEQ